MYELKNGNTVEIPIESIPEGARIWTITDGDTTTFSVRRTSPWFDLVCPVQIGDVIDVEVSCDEAYSDDGLVTICTTCGDDHFDSRFESQQMKVVNLDVSGTNWIIGVENE